MTFSALRCKESVLSIFTKMYTINVCIILHSIKSIFRGLCSNNMIEMNFYKMES